MQHTNIESLSANITTATTTTEQ